MESKTPERFQLKLIGQRAEKILNDHGFDRLPVDPFKLAEFKEIAVQAQSDTKPGFSGVLVKSGDNFGIMYATYLNNPGFERFSVAHELGHYFLEGHPEALFKSTSTHFSKAGFVSDDRLEREADTFAASLLMPEDLFLDIIHDHDVGLSAVRQLAETCQTSLTATAIRYAELIDRPVAVIISTDGKIDYSHFSRSMWRLYQEKNPKRGQGVPRGTPTAQLWQNPTYVTAGRQASNEVDIGDWSDAAEERILLEEATGLGSYGKVLTILSCDTEDEED